MIAWSKLMADSAAMMFASQQVITKRLLLVGNAGPMPREPLKKEMRRMGTEKMRAGMQSSGETLDLVVRNETRRDVEPDVLERAIVALTGDLDLLDGKRRRSAIVPQGRPADL
jgi:hypothetical protein